MLPDYLLATDSEDASWAAATEPSRTKIARIALVVFVCLTCTVLLVNLVIMPAFADKDVTYVFKNMNDPSLGQAGGTVPSIQVTVKYDDKGKFKKVTAGKTFLKKGYDTSQFKQDSYNGVQSQLKDEYRINYTTVSMSEDGGEHQTNTVQTEDQVANSANSFDILKAPAKSILESAGKMLESTTVDGVTNSFDNLFNSTDAWKIVKKAFNLVSTTLGAAILCIIFMIKLIQVSNKIDGSATMPGFKEIVFLFLEFVMLYWVLGNAMNLMTMIYDFFNSISKSIGDATGIGGGGAIGSYDMTGLADDIDPVNAFLIAIIVWLACMLVTVVAYLSIMARSLQAYVMAIFSPVPLSFLGLDATRQYGVGYLKNFIALAITGGIIILVMAFFPPLVKAAVATKDFAQIVGACLVGVTALGKSGAWAKDILGG